MLTVKPHIAETRDNRNRVRKVRLRQLILYWNGVAFGYLPLFAGARVACFMHLTNLELEEIAAAVEEKFNRKVEILNARPPEIPAEFDEAEETVELWVPESEDADA